MNWSFTGTAPIFIQIARQLTDDIFTGVYGEEEQIPSTTEISMEYRLNPATVLKGYSILVERQYIYKRRGIGMFVQKGALERIREERRQQFRRNYIAPMLSEARKLQLDEKQLTDMIMEMNRNEA